MIRYLVMVLLSKFVNRLNVECKRKQHKGLVVDGRRKCS